MVFKNHVYMLLYTYSLKQLQLSNSRLSNNNNEMHKYQTSITYMYNIWSTTICFGQITSIHVRSKHHLLKWQHMKMHLYHLRVVINCLWFSSFTSTVMEHVMYLHRSSYVFGQKLCRCIVLLWKMYITANEIKFIEKEFYQMQMWPQKYAYCK